MQNEINELKETDKKRVKQKNVKIFAGSKNFQGGHRKASRANLLRKRSDELC